MICDAVTRLPVAGFHWHYPAAYILLAPFCSLADMLTTLSLHQLIACLTYVMLLILLGLRTWKTRIAGLIAFAAFATWGILIPHPMARLVSDDPDILLIDFHSHTSYSHDGRSGFTPSANRRWHEHLGFGAAFITDHNVAAGNALVRELSKQGPYISLSGEEVSLYETHIGVLGNRERIDNRPYDSSPANIPLFIEDMHRRGYPLVAHLPEYWREHWRTGNMDFMDWSVDGFEIANSVPYCLDFPESLRRQIIRHCREKNLFMTGVTDNHGWGYATAAWSAMRIPGWRTMSAQGLETAVLNTLRTKRFQAVQVLERRRYNAERPWQIVVSPFVNLWLWLRIMGGWNALSCLVWALGVKKLLI